MSSGVGSCHNFRHAIIWIHMITEYNVAELTAKAKSNLFKLVAKIILCGIFLILSIIGIIFYGSYI